MRMSGLYAQLAMQLFLTTYDSLWAYELPALAVGPPGISMNSSTQKAWNPPEDIANLN